MSFVIAAALIVSSPIPKGCEVIRDGDQNKECAKRALEEADKQLAELRAKIDLVSDRYTLLSLDSKEQPLTRDPREVARAASAEAHSRWLAYREAECHAQNITLDENYETFVSFKQCLTWQTMLRLYSLQQSFGAYFDSLGQTQLPESASAEGQRKKDEMK